MKKFFATLIAACALMASSAHATVETFNTAKSTSKDGFTLVGNWVFQDAGRPYLEGYNSDHSITSAAPFTFTSIDFNRAPIAGYTGGTGNIIEMILRDLSNTILLDVSITLPQTGWFTYSNTIANVSSINFVATRGFWPSVDNLVYQAGATATVPEPAIGALLGLGLLGFATSRRKVRHAKV
ncbi:MAG: PEP-CTERM sorting domain-containing protein [Janthinobacterium lividum]